MVTDPLPETWLFLIRNDEQHSESM